MLFFFLPDPFILGHFGVPGTMQYYYNPFCSIIIFFILSRILLFVLLFIVYILFLYIINTEY